MAIAGLTRQQSDFVERFLKVPRDVGRKDTKQPSRDAAEKLRLFHAEHALLKQQIAAVQDVETQSLFLSQLREAKAVIERNPEALDLEGGHKQLADIQDALALHLRRKDADEAYARIAAVMSQIDADKPEIAKNGLTDVHNDIALTWAYVNEKYANGSGTKDAKNLEDALKTMQLLELMLRDAETAERNPFEAQLGPSKRAKEVALAGLEKNVLAARQTLLETFNQLAGVRAKLDVQFGAEKVPLALRMACQSAQKHLDDAVDAAPAEVPDLADDAEAAFVLVNRNATRLISEALAWEQDHAAFLVRYEVMLGHAAGKETNLIKPRFDEITALYSAAKKAAEQHEYEIARTKIATARNDLKDVLDFADDYANFRMVYRERRALLATLPLPASYPLEQLRENHTEALALLTKAKDAFDIGQMTTALGHLNRIPKAVDDILKLNKFATLFKAKEAEWQDRQNALTGLDTKVQGFIADQIAHSAKAGKAAQDDAAQGAYRRAFRTMSELVQDQDRLWINAQVIADYLVEKAAFAARLKETQERDGPNGRIAIEGYYQALLGDGAKADTAQGRGDFRLAHAMCVRLKNDHADMMQTADEAAQYLVQKARFDSELAKLSGVASADAKEAREAAGQMLVHAVAATVRGNWFAATNLLESAVLDVQRAVSDAQTAALIDGMQGGARGLVLTSDTEFEIVYAVFKQIKDHVAGLDRNGLFSGALKLADDKAVSVKAILTSDLEKAEATLNEAIAACNNVAFKLSAAACYEAQRNTTVAMMLEVETANIDGVADAEIALADDVLDAAINAAKAPLNDFAAAIEMLGKAQAIAGQGLDALAVYTETIKEALDKGSEAIAAFNDPDVVGFLGKEAAALQLNLDEMNTDFEARDLAQAVSKAAKVVDLAGSCVDQCLSCKRAADSLARANDLKVIEQTHPVVAVEMAQAKVLMDAASAALASGDFPVAFDTASRANWMILAARKKAEAFDIYQPVKIACEKELTALEVRNVAAAGPGHSAVLALRETYDAAVAKDTLHNYAGAAKSLDGFVASCHSAAAMLDAYDLYLLQKSRAQKALEQVRELGDPAIETLLVRLEGKDRTAQRLAQSFDFETATEMYIELQRECTNAQDTSDAIEDFAALVIVTKTISDGDTGELNLAIGKARSTLKDMVKRPSAIYVHQEILQCDAQLDRAEETLNDDFIAARRDVREVTDTCVQMALIMAQYDQLNETAAMARGLAASQLSKGKAADFVRDEIGAKVAALEVSMTTARRSRSYRAQTQVDLEDTISSLRDLRKVIDAHRDYLKKLGPIEKTLTRLEKHKLRHLMRNELTEARKLLATAAARAGDRKHAAALAELEQAQRQLDLAKMRATLMINKKPTVKQLEAILETAEGMEMFDDMVAALDVSVQREIMAVAFEARFGCKLELQNSGSGAGDNPVGDDAIHLPAPNIGRFYKEIAKLPPSKTLDDDSILGFQQPVGEQTESTFDPEGKNVIRREGEDVSPGIDADALEHEIGVVDPNAIPKDGESRTVISWNALREVAHAVDDKLGFMKKNGERLAGWKVYGTNVQEPAANIAREFEFDADYVAEYMRARPGSKLPVPQPVNCGPDEWARRMEACRMFVDRARSSNTPWLSASIADACTIGKYTYVESYKNDWCRYLTSARKLAVSGYQFRGPAEWFSELFAAMSSGRLNDNHPHRDEIKALCMKEDA